MALQPVVTTTTVTHDSISDHELEVGVAYAKREYGRDIDHDLLKLMAETTLARRKPKIIMPFLAATVIREIIRRQNKDRQRSLEPKIDAFKGAVMKIMNGRSQVRRRKNDQKRKQGIDIPVIKQTEHPQDPKNVAQYLLFNY